MTRRIHNKKSFLLIFLILIVSISIFFLSKSIFKIQHIICETQYGSCSEELTQLSNSLIGQPLLIGWSEKNIKDHLLSDVVESVEVQRTFPSTVKLMLNLRQPLGYVLSLTDPSQKKLFDGQGVQLPFTDNLSLSQIGTAAVVPTKLSSSDISSLKILNTIQSLTSYPLVGIVEGKILSFRLKNGTEVVIDISSPESQWRNPLQIILERSKIGSKQARKIDLRYSQPIISF